MINFKPVIIGFFLLFLIPNAYAIPKGTYESDNFAVSNMSIVQSNSSTFGKENYVIGIVKNISNKTWEYIQIAVESYDNKNNLIGV